MKTEIGLTWEGYKVKSHVTNTMFDYSFPHGYEKVVIRVYELSTFEFIRESEYYKGPFLYKRHLKKWKELQAKEEEGVKA